MTRVENQISMRYGQVMELFLIEFLFVESSRYEFLFFFLFSQFYFNWIRLILRTLNNLSIFGGFVCTRRTNAPLFLRRFTNVFARNGTNCICTVMDEAAWQPRAFSPRHNGKSSSNWMAGMRFLHFYYADGLPSNYYSGVFTISYHWCSR